MESPINMEVQEENFPEIEEQNIDNPEGTISENLKEAVLTKNNDLSLDLLPMQQEIVQASVGIETKMNEDISLALLPPDADQLDDETLLAKFLEQTEEEKMEETEKIEQSKKKEEPEKSDKLKSKSADLIQKIINGIPGARKSVPQRVTEEIIKNCIEFQGSRLSLGSIIRNVENGTIDLKNLIDVSEKDVEKLLENFKKEARISLPHLIAKNMIKLPKSNGKVEGTTCQICFKKFNDKQTLLRHFRNHSGIKPFECMECNKKFNSKFNLKVHYRTHTGERPYKCFVCDLAFTQQSSLNMHFRIHSGETPFECTECGKQFKQQAELNTHLRVHSGEKPFACPFCRQKFAHRSNFIKHKQTHHEDERLIEENKDLDDNTTELDEDKDEEMQPNRSNSNLINDILVKTLMGEKSESTCSKYNVSIPELITLNMIKLPVVKDGEQLPERPFKCNLCEKDFKERQTLLRHYRNHSGIKPFTCSECSKQFSNKFNLQVHFRRHSGERPYKCTVCDFRFTQQSALNLHFRIHSGETPFECTECGKQFKQQAELEAHSRKHTGDKPYSCDECTKTFAHQSNFIKHKRVHSGVKPYECKQCGQKFTNKSNLNRHYKLHTGERPYTCDICGKGYIQLADMTRHYNTHNKTKKRFSCITCGQKFENGQLLLDHAQTHVKDEESD